MNSQALEGATRLHALLSLLPSVDDHLLDETILATAPEGVEPNPLTHQLAVEFKKFKEAAARISVACQNHKPAFVPRRTSCASSR